MIVTGGITDTMVCAFLEMGVPSCHGFPGVGTGTWEHYAGCALALVWLRLGSHMSGLLVFQ